MKTLGILVVVILFVVGCGSNTGPTGAQGAAGASCDTTRLDNLENAVSEMSARLDALEATQCPRGFTYTPETNPDYIVCTRNFLTATDVMVKVGDFWIDRYEISQCPGGSQDLGQASGYGSLAAACSTQGVQPLGSITWFQAAQLCANAGKALCTNAEWQTAVSGTPDPGAYPGQGGNCIGVVVSTTQCNTCSGGPGAAGQAISCVSRFGANDMIGNLWEWVADWLPGARAATQPTDGQSMNWPSGFSTDDADKSWNVDSRTYWNNVVGWHDGVPAAVMRGAAWGDGVNAGALAFASYHPPAYAVGYIGARCCMSGK